MNKNVERVYHITNTISGGVISQIKESIVGVYIGYLEEKLTELIEAVLEDETTEDDLNNFLEGLTGYEKDTLYTVVKKSLDSKDRINLFILARLLSNQIKNNELNYYEQALLVNIDSLTELDYKIFLKIVNSMTYKDEYWECNVENEVGEIVLRKFMNIGIIGEDKNLLTIGGTLRNVKKSAFTDELKEIVENYFIR